MRENNIIATRENIDARSGFPASFTQAQRNEYVTELLQTAFAYKDELKNVNTEEIILLPEEKEIVKNYLDSVKEKLTSLGITDVNNLLPQLNQIIFIKTSKVFPDRGFVTADGTLMGITLDQDELVSSTRVRNTIYHEISHFITRRVFISSEPIDRIQLGFQHTFLEPQTGDKKHIYNKGIYEEPLSDLFALYCIDNKDEIHYTSYIKQDILMISLLEEFAKQTGITPFEAFKEMFVAKVKMDFSFQKELLDVFGTEAMQSFNNTISMSSKDEKFSKANYSKLAREGHFYIKYMLKMGHERIAKGTKFSGLPGYLKKE